jgi:hypothetical protein
MDSVQLKESILSNAEKIRELTSRIHEAVRTRSSSPDARRKWELACQTFHSRYGELAFPGGYSGALERIVAGDADTIEAALCFLEVRPYFFRSGYMFKDILRKTKRAPLSSHQAARLAQVVGAYALYRAQRAA